MSNKLMNTLMSIIVHNKRKETLLSNLAISRVIVLFLNFRNLESQQQIQHRLSFQHHLPNGKLVIFHILEHTYHRDTILSIRVGLQIQSVHRHMPSRQSSASASSMLKHPGRTLLDESSTSTCSSLITCARHSIYLVKSCILINFHPTPLVAMSNIRPLIFHNRKNTEQMHRQVPCLLYQLSSTIPTFSSEERVNIASQERLGCNNGELFF